MRSNRTDSLSKPTPHDTVLREIALTELSKELPFGSLTIPDFSTATFGFPGREELHAYQAAALKGEKCKRYEYGRYGSPSVDLVERALAIFHGAEAAVLLPSGMSAISLLFLSVLESGSHIIIGKETYRRTREVASSFLTKFGVRVDQVSIGDFDELRRALTPDTRLIFLESPTNPTMRIVDVDRLASLGQEKGVTTVIDATFATPINQLPLKAGVDVVIDSATKYLGGHNKLLGGVVYGSKKFITQLQAARGTIGPMPTDRVAASLWDGLQTLELRVTRQNEVALTVARFLESHPMVETVWYPGLESHPDYQIASKQMLGGGGVVTFTLRREAGSPEGASLEQSETFIDHLKLPILAPSLGSVIGLIESPRTMSFFGKSDEEALSLGIPNNMVRFAVGARTGVELVLADLDVALQKTFGSPLTEELGEGHLGLSGVFLKG